MPNPKGPVLSCDQFPGSELDAEQLEFLQAIEHFKKKYKRRFPTWSEVLVVLKQLGYRRVAVNGGSSPSLATGQVPHVATVEELVPPASSSDAGAGTGSVDLERADGPDGGVVA